MAFSARHVSPHDALSTDRYRPNPLARSLRAAADSKAHLPPFSPRSWMRYPLFSCASWKRNRKRGECRLFATPDWSVRSSCFFSKYQNSLPVSLRERNRSVFSSYSQKEYCSGRRRSRCHIQVIHVSLSCARRCGNRENPVAELHICNCMWYIKKKKRGEEICVTPLGIPLASQPRRFCSLGCSVSSAPGARTKVPLSYPAVSLWKAANGARGRVKISPKSTLCSECSFHPRRRSVLRYSTTPPLITSACHGNFVRQKRNALFWRDCNPWARPKAHLELNAVVVRYEQKGGHK